MGWQVPRLPALGDVDPILLERAGDASVAPESAEAEAGKTDVGLVLLDDFDRGTRGST